MVGGKTGSEDPKVRKGQPIGRHWKSLDLRAGAKLLERLDPDWPHRLRLVENGRDEELWEYVSASTGTTYRLQLTRTATGWLGACSCPGTRKSDLEGSIVPCKHLAALLLLDVDSPFTEEAAKWRRENLSRAETDRGGKDDPGSTPRVADPVDPSTRVGETSGEGVHPDEGKETTSQSIGREIEKVGGHETDPKVSTSPLVLETPVGPVEVDQTPPKGPEDVVIQSPEITDRTIVHRCSSLPLVGICPAAVAQDDEISVGNDGPMARVGTAAHEVFEMIVRGEVLNATTISKAATMAGCPDETDEVRMLAAMAYNLWNTGVVDRETGTVKAQPVKSYFKGPRTEVPLEHRMKAPTGESILVKGSADVYDVITGEDGVKRAIILDLKTGRKDRNHGDQLAGYAVGAMGQDKEIREVVLIVLWARLGFYDVLVLTREEVTDWARRFLRYTAVWDGKTYTTGEHCTYCRRMASCEARTRNLRTMVDVFRGPSGLVTPDIVDREGNLVDPDTLADLVGIARQIQTCADSFVRAVADQIGIRGAQPLKSRPGMALGFTERSKTRTIDAGKGWETLRTFLTDGELASIVSVGLTPVLDTVAKKAEKGQGAARKREVEEALRLVGALPDPGKSRTLTIIKLEGGENGGE